MKLSVAVAFALVALASPAFAQGKSRGQERDKDKEIPASARPPAGMCRIWLDGVPAAQQPAPTDCPTAVRNRPAKGRVIFGDDYVQPRRDTTRVAPPTKGFAPSTSRKPLIRLP